MKDYEGVLTARQMNRIVVDRQEPVKSDGGVQSVNESSTSEAFTRHFDHDVARVSRTRLPFLDQVEKAESSTSSAGLRYPFYSI